MSKLPIAENKDATPNERLGFFKEMVVKDKKGEYVSPWLGSVRIAHVGQTQGWMATNTR